MSDEFDLGTYYPILAFLLLLIIFAISVMVIAHTLGPRSDTKGKQVPYESGMDPIGDARQRFDIKFYLVAIMFLVFDVELLFLYPWAVMAYSDRGPIEVPRGAVSGPLKVVREGGEFPPVVLQGPIFWCVLTFIALLFLAYLYDWKKGVFRWR